MKYSDKLKDPRWQKKRLKILERDEWQCQKCGEKENTLHVHHLRYFPNKEPWEYLDEDLLTLCCDCHEYETEARKEYESQLIDMLRAMRFLADDVQGVMDFLFAAVQMYHPQHLSEALRWNLRNKNGVIYGRKLLKKMITNFECQGRYYG
jgi:hypothetical protein